jgi:hypothetical protein
MKPPRTTKTSMETTATKATSVKAAAPEPRASPVSDATIAPTNVTAAEAGETTPAMATLTVTANSRKSPPISPQRNEHGRERQRHRDDDEADFLRAEHGGLERRPFTSSISPARRLCSGGSAYEVANSPGMCAPTSAAVGGERPATLLKESREKTIVWPRDGRLVVAAYGDGTIRWHKMDDGRELLALFVLKDRQNWVAWTPEGFYGATPGAFGVLQWHVNRGSEAAAETVPVSAIPRLRRPDALALVLQQMETARALGVADMTAARKDVRSITRSAKAPGARLHVLTVGVSEYGDRAKQLRLKFADRDAQDVASALINTQDGGLYAEVKTQFLHDGTANKEGIFDALAATERNMAGATADDLAVIMFSGHGTMIDGQFYLVPYGVDDSTPARLKSSAIPASEFQTEIAKLAAHGRVLVLLDACRSASLIGKALPGADMLRSVLAGNNVTVLTSSMADKLSREDEKWQHGAFTKALLDALGSADEIDTDRNGVISMAELTAYLAKHLDELTGGDQQLGLEQRFQGDLFVSGL